VAELKAGSGVGGAYMNIHNMHVARYIIAVSEELSFTAAAKRCGISQPSLSNAIQALEEEIGGPLFLRTYRTRGVKITTLGAQVLPQMRRIQQAMDALGAIAAAQLVHQAREADGRKILPTQQ
jgi:DNA-binding transcriptional LysR family regulator